MHYLIAGFGKRLQNSGYQNVLITVAEKQPITAGIVHYNTVAIHYKTNATININNFRKGQSFALPRLNGRTSVTISLPKVHTGLLIDFTLSNARRFYSLMGNPLKVKGLRYRGPIAWDLTPISLKQSPHLANLKYLLQQQHDKCFETMLAFLRKSCICILLTVSYFLVICIPVKRLNLVFSVALGLFFIQGVPFLTFFLH